MEYNCIFNLQNTMDFLNFQQPMVSLNEDSKKTLKNLDMSQIKPLDSESFLNPIFHNYGQTIEIHQQNFQIAKTLLRLWNQWESLPKEKKFEGADGSILFNFFTVYEKFLKDFSHKDNFRSPANGQFSQKDCQGIQLLCTPTLELSHDRGKEKLIIFNAVIIDNHKRLGENNLVQEFNNRWDQYKYFILRDIIALAQWNQSTIHDSVQAIKNIMESQNLLLKP
jgi:hypothetical protein